MAERQIKVSQNVKDQLGNFLRKTVAEETVYKPFLPNFFTLTPDKSGYIAYPKNGNSTQIDPTRYERRLTVEEHQNPKKRSAEETENKKRKILKISETTTNQSSNVSGQMPALASMPTVTVTQSFNTGGIFSNSAIESKFKESEDIQKYVTLVNPKKTNRESEVKDPRQQPAGQKQEVTEKKNKRPEEKDIIERMDILITREIDEMAVTIQLEALQQRKRQSLQQKNKKLQTIIREKLSKLQ